MTAPTTKPDIHSCEYDEAQDMLFIEFEPIAEYTYYTEVEDDPYIMRRYTRDGDRLVGISVQFPTRQLGTVEPSPAAIRHLAEELVARYARASDTQDRPSQP